MWQAHPANTPEASQRVASPEIGNVLLSAINQVSDIIMVTTRAGDIEYVNRAFEVASGFPGQEACGQPARILKSGRLDAAFYRGMWDTILAGHTFRGRFVNRRRDGAIFVEDKTIVPIFDQRGDISHFISVGRDITRFSHRRQKAANEIRLYREFARSFPGIAYREYVRKRQRTTLLGRKVALITGLTPEELNAGADFPLHRLMLPEDQERRRSTVGEALAAGRPFEITYAIRQGDRDTRHLVEYGMPIFDAEGRPRQIDGVILDITDRRRLEVRLEQSEASLRALSARFLCAHETERKRISRELHDGLGQILTTLKMRIENACFLLGLGRSDDAIPALSLAAPMIRQAMDEVRRISTNLRPSVLDDLGIIATIRWFCRAFSDVHRSIRVETELSIAEQDMPEELKTVVYRLLQEAMTNIVKHANATLVRVRLCRSGPDIEFSIEDNGVGFDIDDALRVDPAARGMGLAGMRERVKISHGDFWVTSRAGAGSRVRAVWTAAAQEGRGGA